MAAAVPINPVPAPARVLWFDGTSPGELVVRIRTIDRAGLLAMLTAVFERDGMDILPANPVTFGTAIGALALVALVATWLPAYRASRVDPLVALRQE